MIRNKVEVDGVKVVIEVKYKKQSYKVLVTKVQFDEIEKALGDKAIIGMFPYQGVLVPRGRGLVDGKKVQPLINVLCGIDTATFVKSGGELDLRGAIDEEVQSEGDKIEEDEKDEVESVKSEEESVKSEEESVKSEEDTKDKEKSAKCKVQSALLKDKEEANAKLIAALKFGDLADNKDYLEAKDLIDTINAKLLALEEAEEDEEAKPVRGVHWHKRKSCWEAACFGKDLKEEGAKSKRWFLGYFDEVEEANKAVKIFKKDGVDAVEKIRLKGKKVWKYNL